MDMTFKGALALSILLHTLIMSPFYNLNTETRRIERKKPVVVDYVKMAKPEKIEGVKNQAAAEAAETPKIELKDKVEIIPSANIGREALKKTEIDKDTPADAAKKQAQIESTKDYVGYYNLIRERIRRRLKIHYRDWREEGVVGLRFSLSANGLLESFGIDETASAAGKTLRDMAILSIREASPFPPFPKGINLPRMSFDLTISFKKK